MVPQPVHGRGAEKGRPFVDVAIEALADDLVEVHWLVLLQGPKPQVIDDQQVGLGESSYGRPVKHAAG